jgi:hypothetical protein
MAFFQFRALGSSQRVKNDSVLSMSVYGPHIDRLLMVLYLPMLEKALCVTISPNLTCMYVLIAPNTTVTNTSAIQYCVQLFVCSLTYGEVVA